MKKIAKLILLKRAFVFFCLSGAIIFTSGIVNAQVFEPGVRSAYSGVTTSFEYDAYGRQTAIVPVWQLTGTNRYGQPLHEILGDNLLTQQYKYSAEGLPTERIFQKGSTTIQHQQYEFNALKNSLDSRTNHYGITETFEHDALSQLKRVSSFGNNLDIQYDALGNITQKTDVGAYGYNVSNNPYAVSEITGYAGAIPSLEQRVTYTSFRRPAAIEEENGYHTSFTYNADWQRVKMEVQHNDSPQLTRYYLGNNYEKDITPGHTVERLYIGGTAYHASAVFIKDDDGAWALHYIIRDHLGSVTGLTDEQGTPVAEYSYDPWGRLRDPQTLQAYALGQEPALLLGRGFTGHEHLPWHGFINMNARLYDPLLGRFLSPDPYVQLPDIVRSYNRYSYCMNNPLMYVDENGEFLLAFLTGFFKGLFSGGAPFKEGWNSVRNEFNIVTGLFKSNMHNSFWQGLWEITSRFTWQMSQTFLGYSMAYTGNVATLVDDVDFYGGATVVKYYGDWGAVTLGSYMNGGETIAADPNNTLFQHEYGHYLQSQAWGWAYLSRAAIPSLFDIFGRDGDHKFHPIEQDANMRAFKYFNEYVEEFYQTESEYLSNSGKGWDFATNPLDIYGNGYDKYVDYRDANQMELVNALKVIPSFLDYISGSLNYITGDAALLFNQLPALIYGFRNHVHYNKHKFRINYKK